MARTDDEYEDDRDRRERGERRDRDDDAEFDDRDRPRRNVVEQAKSKVQAPAILLILTGVISLGLVIWGFVTLSQFDDNVKLQIEAIENNPGIQADQKKMQVDLIQKIAKTIKPLMLPSYISATIIGLLTIFAGVRFMSLKGRGLVIATSILSMIPMFSGCCCLGIPAGIWALIAANNSTVVAGMRQVARVAENRGDDY
jgi:hypothetical protein